MPVDILLDIEELPTTTTLNTDYMLWTWYRLIRFYEEF